MDSEYTILQIESGVIVQKCQKLMTSNIFLTVMPHRDIETRLCFIFNYMPYIYLIKPVDNNKWNNVEYVKNTLNLYIQHHIKKYEYNNNNNINNELFFNYNLEPINPTTLSVNPSKSVMSITDILYTNNFKCALHGEDGNVDLIRVHCQNIIVLRCLVEALKKKKIITYNSNDDIDIISLFMADKNTHCFDTIKLRSTFVGDKIYYNSIVSNVFYINHYNIVSENCVSTQCINNIRLEYNTTFSDPDVIYCTKSRHSTDLGRYCGGKIGRIVLHDNNIRPLDYIVLLCTTAKTYIGNNNNPITSNLIQTAKRDYNYVFCNTRKRKKGYKEVSSKNNNNQNVGYYNTYTYILRFAIPLCPLIMMINNISPDDKHRDKDVGILVHMMKEVVLTTDNPRVRETVASLLYNTIMTDSLCTSTDTHTYVESIKIATITTLKLYIYSQKCNVLYIDDYRLILNINQNINDMDKINTLMKNINAQYNIPTYIESICPSIIINKRRYVYGNNTLGSILLDSHSDYNTKYVNTIKHIMHVAKTEHVKLFYNNERDILMAFFGKDYKRLRCFIYKCIHFIKKSQYNVTGKNKITHCFRVKNIERIRTLNLIKYVDRLGKSYIKRVSSDLSYDYE